MRSTLRCVSAVLVLASCVSSLSAGGHTWRVKEIFSNADGTIQFIEVWESLGGAGEVGTAGHNITSSTHAFPIPSNVASPSSFRSLLFGTPDFAALGVVAPDYIIPANFFSTVADTIAYTPLHSVTFGAGQLPTDGVLSLNANLATGVNSPQNYAGDMGSVDLGPAGPPGVPGGGANPLAVEKSAGDGSQLRLAFDTASCDGSAGHQLIHGFGSGLPLAPGGVLSIGGAVCGLAGSPFDWTGVPDPSTDATGLLWFLIQATDGGTVEGSWGFDSAGIERNGPGPSGSSGQCGVTDKDLSNPCGQ